MTAFRRFALALAASAALGALAAPVVAQPRAFTEQDLATLDRVSDPQASPDGRWAVWQVRATDWEANRGVVSLWAVDLKTKGSKPRRLPVSEGGANTPRFGPDGSLYFLSSRSGSSQVWRTTAEGAEATQVTDLPLDVGAFKPSPDGRRLVVSMAVFPDCDTLDCTVRRQAEKPEGSGVLHEKVFVRHWDAWADGTRNHLFAVEVGAEPAKAATALTRGFDGDVPSKPFGDDAEIAFTRDGSAVIFSARLAGTGEPWSTNFDLWRAPVDGSAAPANLTAANPAWDTGPVVSPDGRTLAYRAMKRPGFEADRLGIMLMDLATGAVREIAPTWDRSADDIAWSADGKSLYVLAADVGQTRLFAVDAKTGKVRPLTGEGHVAGFDVGRDGVVYAQDDMDSPAQIFRVAAKGGKAERLSDHNADKLQGVGFGGFEQFSFTGWNGETVHGYVVKPHGWKEGEKYPVAFLIHGGPQSSFGNAWSYRWNPQVFAGAGYAAVMIDFHGSVGYGQAFTDSITQHWGDRPLEDLQKGWAAAQAKYPWLDGGRACALGASYGGYMINWIAGNWSEPWRCLVNHDGIFDLRSMAYSTEELWFTEWENGGVPWENQATIERFNPVNHVQNWKTPMLVVQGGCDYRVPTEQSLSTFNALQRREIPSQFLYFDDENHWVLKPRNAVQWHGAMQAWLDRWTKE